jgi:hypothetical protein
MPESYGGELLEDLNIAGLIEAVRRRYAPDRRTAVLDIRAELHGNSVVLTGEVHHASLKADVIAFVKEWSGREVWDGLAVLPDAVIGEKCNGVITVSVANLHRLPDLSATVVTQALLGTAVNVLKKEGEWFYIQMPDNYLGWISETMAWMGPEDFARWNELEKVITTANHACVHQNRDLSSRLISDLVAGDILGLLDQTEAYCRVVFPDGRAGYCDSRAVRPVRDWLSHAQATPETIVSTARRFMGVPYLWGGTSAKAFDCSGFVKTVYFLNGLLLPRDADQQARVGNAVAIDERMAGIQPGDLLFFGRPPPAGPPTEITHVGISLGGKRFLEASGSVRESSLDPAQDAYAPRRAATFACARGIVGAETMPGVGRLRDML